MIDDTLDLMHKILRGEARLIPDSWAAARIRVGPDGKPLFEILAADMEHILATFKIEEVTSGNPAPVRQD